MKLLLLLSLLSLASCGTTICYTHPETGIRICEKIDGQFNPQIDLDDLKLGDKDYPVEVIPSK